MNTRTIQTLSIALFVLLILWGTYTLLVYLGIPYHGAALLTDPTMRDLTTGCEATEYICRGSKTLWPFVLFTLKRVSPLLWYGIIAVLAWAGIVLWQKMGLERQTVRIAWTPWKILLLFVASVWLISTTISFSSFDGRDLLTYPEPTKETYNVSEHALQTIQGDYQTLLAGGCLDLLGESQAGAKLYTLKAWCIEKAFVGRVIPQMLFVILFLGELLILGRMALQWIKYRQQTLLLETVFSLGLGASLGIAILWSLAVAGVFTSTLGWALAVLIPVVGYRHTRYWLEKFLWTTWEREYNWYDPAMLLGMLLIGYLALNFLQVVRPFPIGWDDLGSYLNRPRLLVSYGRFISSMTPFDWSYLTSTGFLLFGYNSPVGATASMMVNWSAGLLAVLSILAFARTFLGERSGLLSALLYYSLPLVGHFSYADMKIDNAIFFFGTIATLAVMLALVRRDEDGATPHGTFDLQHSVPLLMMAGIFLGFAFSTKVTAVMVALPLAALMIGILLDWRAFVGMCFFICFAYLWRGVASAQVIAMRIIGDIPPPWLGTAVIWMLFCAGLACVLWSLSRRRPSSWMNIGKLLGAFAVGVAIAIFPWAEHTAIENGQLYPQPFASAPNTLSPKIDTSALPPELAVDQSGSTCAATGVFEELDRYWGFEKGWSHYLTLPWRTVMNIDATGYYVTTIPALLLFPLLLLLPYFWSKPGRWLRWLFGITTIMILEWMFLGNGIPWYGIGILLGLVIGLEALIQKAPDKSNHAIAWILVTFSLFSAFNMRFWQFEQQRNIFEYSMGKVSADALREITIPYYDAISATAVVRHDEMKDRPYLYRVGTFIPYFIPRNLEIIGLNDHQLDVFNCLYHERDPALTVKRLKALKFNAIVFDTNTATIERDEQGSLHKKVNAFVDFVNNPVSGLQVVVSDTNAGIAFILIP